MKQQLLVLYVILVLLTGFYLFGVENLAGGDFHLDMGGRNHVFSLYDVSLFLVFILASALSVISFMAYNRKKSNRLFFVSFAFFLFALKAALKLIDNFLLGGYSYMGISIQVLEFLILLSLFYALFRK